MSALDAGFGFETVGLAVTTAEPMPDRQAPSAGPRPGAGRDARRYPRPAHRAPAHPASPRGRATGRSAPREPCLGRSPPCPTRPSPGPAPRPVPPGEAAQDVFATAPEGPPHRFRWRAQEHRVTRAEGPERIAPEWWHEAGEPRDYYRIECEAGRRLWLYRDGPHGRTSRRRGFVHGMFPMSAIPAGALSSSPSPRTSLSCVGSRPPQEYVAQAAAYGLSGIGGRRPQHRGRAGAGRIPPHWRWRRRARLCASCRGSASSPKTGSRPWPIRWTGSPGRACAGCSPRATGAPARASAASPSRKCWTRRTVRSSSRCRRGAARSRRPPSSPGSKPSPRRPRPGHGSAPSHRRRGTSGAGSPSRRHRAALRCADGGGRRRPLSPPPDRRPLQDVLTCIREGCTIGAAGYRWRPMPSAT